MWSHSSHSWDEMQTDIQNTCGLHSVSKIFSVTLPETNIALENQCVEDYVPFGNAYFQGLRWLQGGYLQPRLYQL